jgi:hypothetical protein
MKRKEDKKIRTFYDDNRTIIKSIFVTLSLFGMFAWANLGLNHFSSGSTISATEVNDNFQALENAILNPKSDLVYSNTSSLLLDETDSQTPSYTRVLIFDAIDGLHPGIYNTTTGVLSLSESGLYNIIMFAKATTASGWTDIRICADEDQGTNDCLTESKPINTLNAWFDHGKNPNGETKNILVKLDAAKTYRFVYSKGKYSNTFNTNDFNLYLKKIR